MRLKNVSPQNQIIETTKQKITVRPGELSPEIDAQEIYLHELERIRKFFVPVIEKEAPPESPKADKKTKKDKSEESEDQ